MVNTVEDDNLEKARARLETALSRLASGVASSKKAMRTAHMMAVEKSELAVRVAALEEQNLELHEEIATLNLKAPQAANDGMLETLRQEKTAIKQNYMLLKKQYMRVQDQLDAASDNSAGKKSGAASNADGKAITALEHDNDALRHEVESLQSEKDGIKERLDASIGKLEELLGG